VGMKHKSLPENITRDETNISLHTTLFY